MNRRKLQSEKGQSLVLIALLMVGMIGVLGLVLDGGGTFLTRRRSQDAADAAAFAGVRALATRPDESAASETSISNAILTYAAVNGVASPVDVHATFIDDHGNDICVVGSCGGVPSSPLATGIRVTTTLHLEPYFIRLLIGNQPIPVPAVAAAQSGVPSATRNLMPVTLKARCSDVLTDPNCGFEYGQEYVLFGEMQSGGNFQWTNYSDPCDTTPGDLVAYLMGTKKSGLVAADPLHQHMTPVAQPYWTCGSTGVEGSRDVRAALYWWITKPEDERHWIVPIFDGNAVASGSNTMYHIIMFADFVLTGYDLGEAGTREAPGRYPDTFRCPAPPITPTPVHGGGGGGQLKCIKGKFYKQAEPLQILPGQCNVNGVNICGIGFSQ